MQPLKHPDRCPNHCKRDAKRSLPAARASQCIVIRGSQVGLDDFRVQLNLGRRSQGDGLPVGEGQDPVGHRRNQAHVVFDHQYGGPELPPDVLDPEPHIAGFFRRKPGRRLIQEDELRLHGKRPSDFHHLPNTVREACDRVVPIGLEFKEIDDPLDRATMRHLFPPDGRAEDDLGGKAGPAARVASDQQVLQHGGVFEELDVLECAGDAEFRDFRGPALQEAFSLEPDIPRRRLTDARDQVEQRRLAGPVGPDNGKDLTSLHAEGDVIQRRNPAEADRDAPHVEQGHRSRSVLR